MTRHLIVVASLLCAVVCQQGSTQDVLDVTMRVIEDPAEVSDAVIIVIGNENDVGRPRSEAEVGGEAQSEPSAPLTP